MELKDTEVGLVLAIEGEVIMVGGMLDGSVMGLLVIVAAAMREGELSPMLSSVVPSLDVAPVPEILLPASALKPVPHWQQLNTRPSMKAGPRAHQSGTSHRKRR